MVSVRFERVSALPSLIQPDTLYFVKPSGATAIELYVSGRDGVAYPIGLNEPAATIFNTAGNTLRAGNQVEGFIAMADAIDARLNALGYPTSIYDTAGNTTLTALQVVGFMAEASSIDSRLSALGV